MFDILLYFKYVATAACIMILHTGNSMLYIDRVLVVSCYTEYMLKPNRAMVEKLINSCPGEGCMSTLNTSDNRVNDGRSSLCHSKKTI